MSTEKKFFKQLATLETIQKTYEKSLEQLGKKIRTEIMIPLCRKHKLIYLSCNGTYYFESKSKECFGHTGQLLGKSQRDQELAPVLDFLNKEISYHNCICYYVGDVTSKDY